MTGDRHVRFCGSPGATAPGPPDYAQRVPVGARARACVHRGRQEAARSPSVCRCLKVSRSGCYAWLGREPSRTVRRRKELGALVEWVLNSSRATLRAAAASHAAGARRGVETTPGGGAHPPVREQGPPGRGHAERTRRHRPRAAGPRGSRPDQVRRGLPPPASRESRWVGDIHLYPHPGGLDLPGDRPRLLHEESSRGRHWGDSTRHRPPGVRGDRYGGPQTPAHDRGRRYSTRFHSGRGCQYTSAQLADHLESHGTRSSVGRTGVRWTGARTEAGGRDPQGTRGPIRWSTTARTKAIRDTASQVEPGTHDQRQLHSALGHRTQGEADQEHRAARQAARDTTFRAVRDTPGISGR